MNPKTLFGLVCAGGGARGAYQVGVLKYIHEKFSDGQRSPFQIFTGASCGALNTTFYAAQSHDARQSRLWLEELWQGFHVPAYHGNILKNTLISFLRNWRKPAGEKRTVWALLDPAPMMNVIQRGFQRENLEEALRRKTTLGVAIAATELYSGHTCWFEEGQQASAWNLFHSLGIVDKLQPVHLAASCSVPIFLPPVKIGSLYFLDGTISLDRPLSAAISMGATRILSIGTDKPVPADLPIATANPPRISHVIRLLLNRLGHDASHHEAVELEVFNRFYQALSRRKKRTGRGEPPLPLFHEEALPSHYHPVHVFCFSPSKRIRETAGAIEEPTPPDLRYRHTRFMFHKKFIQELVDLGYEDAKAKHEELEGFFLPEASRRRWFYFWKKAA